MPSPIVRAALRAKTAICHRRRCLTDASSHLMSLSRARVVMWQRLPQFAAAQVRRRPHEPVVARSEDHAVAPDDSLKPLAPPCPQGVPAQTPPVELQQVKDHVDRERRRLILGPPAQPLEPQDECVIVDGPSPSRMNAVGLSPLSALTSSGNRLVVHPAHAFGEPGILSPSLPYSRAISRILPQGPNILGVPSAERRRAQNGRRRSHPEGRLGRRVPI